MSNDDLTHENFDFRGFDVPDLKAVTLASSSDGDQSKQPKTKHEDASKNRKHGKKKSNPMHGPRSGPARARRANRSMIMRIMRKGKL